ncbi:dephospho-CoA kinase [uncultured Lactobacillus sp.]|uniref:dephospho-CoA kinase n=1 Tax=uncultured Lactobacillus sp. TaxID=153152 RepID=UPI002602D289|nr:dephospho-CoA kinase [uncultured Lactobacillus sp.]
MTYFLGLTGGIATGKTTADSFFKKGKIPVIDADQVAHELMNKGKQSYQAIVVHFGRQILDQDGSIDRKKLAEIVFNDKTMLKELNQITHPIIRNEILMQMHNYELKKVPLVILDVPLLFEAHYEDLCNSVVVISSSPQLQLARLQIRNNLNKEQAISRINSQMSLQEKEKLADFVVLNNGSVSELEDKLNNILVKIGIRSSAR